MLQIQKAQKSQVKLKLALTGTSGSGKTFSALVIATGLGKKILVVDTENGSASLYADKFEFDTIVVHPPFTPQTVTDAINLAVTNGYDTIILDSISHYWAGTGGLLQQKEALDATGKGNGFTNWAKMTPMQEKMIDSILQSPINIIATMRSKQEHVIENVNGKNVPKKVGLAPIQRDGVEYEFTTVFDLSNQGMALASKDRTGLWSATIPFMITPEVGKTILEWCQKGVVLVVNQPKNEGKMPETPKDTPKQEKPQETPPKAKSSKDILVDAIVTAFTTISAGMKTKAEMDMLWSKILLNAGLPQTTERSTKNIKALTEVELTSLLKNVKK